MALLDKNAILKADDLEYEVVEVPEWGGSVRLKTLTGEERDEFEASQVTINKKGRPEQNMANLRARLVALVVVDEAGKTVFSKYDVPDLGRKSSKALDRVFEKASAMNGFSDEDMEKLAQDFGGGPNEGSTSDSASDGESPSETS
ncbi:hypothetical protein OV450_3425 [Actinobacteria bacterium OV450]|nr:hypothetical protein OV450_3425 [Actinobacteria bacterium OV450]